MLWNTNHGDVAIGNTKMSYVSFGRGERVFIILPGLSDGLATVRGKALLLAKPYKPFFEQFTVFMFSRKDEMVTGYSIQDMATDQAEALRQLGIRKASVMGVSQGGMIAQCLAIDHPELVETLVLAVTAPSVNEIIESCVKRWIALAEQGNHKALMIDTAEKGYSEAYLQKFRKIYPVIGAIGKPKSYDRFLVNARAILGFSAREELDQIDCPTLVIGGAEDQTVGIQASYELHERIHGSQLHVYQDLGHAAYEEAKDFNERVLAFLEASASG
ncbi:MAG: alpha/beta hydrolase [Clostridia bacterium]|nr:alpha/beta hydrolase [Clostridia bacterium]